MFVSDVCGIFWLVHKGAADALISGWMHMVGAGRFLLTRNIYIIIDYTSPASIITDYEVVFSFSFFFNFSFVYMQVAWLRVDTQTILTIQSHVITKNHRIGITHSENRIWQLRIRDVRETDRGWYMCQINTDPMKSQTGFLDVVGKKNIPKLYSNSWINIFCDLQFHRT